MELNCRINTRHLKTKEAILKAADTILCRYHVQDFFHISTGTIEEEDRIQIGKGRPGKHTKYKRIITTVLTLGWTRNTIVLHREARVDGIFALLSTDIELTSKEVLQAYKYQPRLEKRFSQFKHIHHGAPLLFKKLERIEATMFAFFISLMIQALIEREVRQHMAKRKIPAIAVYPEDRQASHPTTAKIMGIFEDVSTYKLTFSSNETKEYRDDLTDVQQIILDLLEIPQTNYWIK